MIFAIVLSVCLVVVFAVGVVIEKQRSELHRNNRRYNYATFGIHV